MKAADSNVVLRIMLADDPQQSPRARDLVRAEGAIEPLRIDPIVLLEVARVLGRVRKLDRGSLADHLEAIVLLNEFAIAGQPAVSRAIALFREGPADFADYLIGELNRDAGCSTTFTFDQDAARHPAFTLVS